MQMEFEWDRKYNSMLENKNSEIGELWDEMKVIIGDLKNSHANEMIMLKKESGLDIETISRELKGKLGKEMEQNESLKG